MSAAPATPSDATTDAVVAPTNVDMTMVAFAQFAGQGEDTCGRRP
jgi:hypothetical protein